MTPDPYRGSGHSNSPQSWNKYAYVVGDPVNRFDRSGLDGDDPGDPSGCAAQFADASQPYDASSPCSGAGDSCFAGMMSLEEDPDAATFYAQAAAMGCASAAASEVAQTPALPTPECSVSLYERPAGGKHRPWQHTYIVIEDTLLEQSGYAADELILQAGPSNNFPIGGTLKSEIALPGTGYGRNKNNASNPAINKEIGSPYMGANACLDVLDLLQAVGNYNNSEQVPYMAVPIPFFHSRHIVTHLGYGYSGLRHGSSCAAIVMRSQPR